MLQNIFWAALQGTVEYQNWGWNTITISAGVMVLITSVEMWGTIEQTKAVWKEKNGDSISNIFFTYGVSFFFVVAIFGLHERSGAMVFNAVFTGGAQAGLIIGLLKYKEFSMMERWLAALFALTIVWEALTPYKSESYMVLSFGLWYAFGAQLWELWKEGKTGVVKFKLVSSYFVATAAWTTFAFVGDNPWFKFSQIGIFTLISAIFVLWLVWWWRERIEQKNAEGPA